MGSITLIWLWCGVDVVLPILLLPAVLWAAKITPMGREHIKVMNILKDGQLYWVLVTLDFSTIYDIIAKDVAGKIAPWLICMIVFLALALVPFTMLVGFTSAKPVELFNKTGASRREWLSHYTVFVSSVVLSILFGIVATIIHVKLTGSNG